MNVSASVVSASVADGRMVVNGGQYLVGCVLYLQMADGSNLQIDGGNTLS